MWEIKLTEWRTNKVHKYNIKTNSSIQWYSEGNILRVTEYYTGKTLRRINKEKFGCCSIECTEKF